MDRILKNTVTIALTLALLAVSISAGYFVYYYSKSIQPSAFRSFSVTSEGKVSAVPDVAQFTFSVITEGGSDLNALQTENTNKVNQAIEYVKKSGIEDKDISTVDYNVSPRYQYSNCQPDGICPPAEIVGYTISQTVAVKVRDFDKIGDLLSGVVQQGANSVSQLNFTIDEPFELQTQARIKAIAQAKQKADDIARAGGFKVGRLLSIEEGSYIPPYISRDFGVKEGMGGSVGVPAPAPAVEPGSQEIIVTVTLRYEIK